MANVILNLYFFGILLLSLVIVEQKERKKATDSDKEPVGTVHTHSVFLREKNLKLPLNVFFRLLNFSIFIPPTQFLVISDNRH